MPLSPTLRQQAITLLAETARVVSQIMEKDGDNCGTGAGGFQAGNTCARGGGGDSSPGRGSTPLEGLPQKPLTIPQYGEITPGPFVTARQAAEKYMKSAGLPYDPPTKYAKVDPERAKKVAAEYEKMPHAPNDPEVKAAYNAMITETMAQYQAIKETGLVIEFNKPGENPYPNPRMATEDVRRNNHLYVFPTNDGFGTPSDFNADENPLLADSGEKFGDQPALANDIFRAVHDYFGHIKEGNGFRADGEENAWRSHSVMFSPLARRAMTSETRGQNSWLNYGPHGEANRTAKVEDTIFADQKTGIMPEWVALEGAKYYGGTEICDERAGGTDETSGETGADGFSDRRRLRGGVGGMESLSKTTAIDQTRDAIPEDFREWFGLKDNCGIGPGGFQPGNTCARGGEGGDADGDGNKPSSKITSEPVVKPKQGRVYEPDVDKAGEDGVTTHARVGVPAMEVPPPPGIGQLPNLTEHERLVEKSFIDWFEADPDRASDAFLAIVKASTKPGEAAVFGTDDAKVLTTAWVAGDPNQRAQNRATLNTPLHQTANAIAKRAFLSHLDTLKPGDEVLVTVGGCGCHVADTPLMLADGSLKMVQDIQVGDDLMGPDSKPRRVLQLIRGCGKLYRVIPKRGTPFVVNEDHVMAVQTMRGLGSMKRSKLLTIEITVKDILARGSSFVKSCYLYRVGVEYPTVPVALDPYFLGVWLGNGTHSLPQVTSRNNEVVGYLREFAAQFSECELVEREKDSLTESPNKAKDYKIALIDKHAGKGHYNPVVQLLKQVGVFCNKHIPKQYLINDRNTRLRLLAGLLDTDGSMKYGTFEITTKDERMGYDIARLARSLGFYAYIRPKLVTSNFLKEPRTYWRVTISGDTDQIPTKVAHKQAKPRAINKCVLRAGFKLEPAGDGAYFGFTLEGDGLYLMDDFTVTHNSGKGYALKNVPQALEMKAKSQVVFDSAGDQNATENPWILKEAEARGLKVNYVYVHADPKTQWADPERGAMKRASDPKDGRMVDAFVYADSHAIGARNHQAFYEANKDNPNANFVFLDNTGKPKLMDGIPESALKIDRIELATFALQAAMKADIPPHVRRGAMMGMRIWGDD